MFDKKAYMKEWRKRNKNYIREHQREWRKKHPHSIEKYRLKNRDKRLKKSSEYHRKNRRTKHVGYGGVCFCPRCGKKGYKRFNRNINIKTGGQSSIYTQVQHQHGENGKTVCDGNCYIGVGVL